MAEVQPLKEKDLKQFQFFFKAVEEGMGFVPNSLKTMARLPAVMGNLSAFLGLMLGDPVNAKPMIFLKLFFKNLVWSSKLMKDKNRVPLYLRHLVSYVTSTAAGCYYCQAHTLSSSKGSGVTDEKLKAIWEFESNPLFDEKERAALQFALAAGSMPNAVTSDHFTELRKHFTENQIVELGTIISLFGYLNRWNQTFSTQLENEPLNNATELLKGTDWEVGKHG